MKPSMENKIIEGLENFADALENDEDLTTRFTCRKVTLNLEPAKAYRPEDVKEIRAILGASQPLFAQFLGVSTKTVQSWERGEKSPMPLACRFMDSIREDGPYWRKCFQAKLSPKVGKKDRTGKGRKKERATT